MKYSKNKLVIQSRDPFVGRLPLLKPAYYDVNKVRPNAKENYDGIYCIYAQYIEYFKCDTLVQPSLWLSLRQFVGRIPHLYPACLVSLESRLEIRKTQRA